MIRGDEPLAGVSVVVTSSLGSLAVLVWSAV
jgi:hypothetical protein